MKDTYSDERLVRTYRRTINRLLRDELIAASTSAGMIYGPKDEKPGERTGFQVFVEVAEWSEELQKNDALSGGLLKYAGWKRKTPRELVRMKAKK